MEIRKLDASNQPALYKLMEGHKGYNIFILGNVHSLGWDSPMLEYWGAFAPDLTAVLMRYNSNWAAWWTKPGEFIGNFGRIIASFPDTDCITGHPDIIDSLRIPGFSIKKRYNQHLAVLDKLLPPPAVCDARWARPEDVDEVLELYQEDEIPRARAGLLRRINTGGLAVGLVEGRMVSAAAVTARSEDSAMIGGVWTLPQERQRGYGSWCTAWLCQQLMDSGITPTLFYHNPVAGSIYRKMGFSEIGPYAMITLERS